MIPEPTAPKTSWRFILAALASMWIPLGGLLVWLVVQTEFDPKELLVEPAALMGDYWYRGAFSTIGGLLWWGSGAILLFSSSLCLPKDRSFLASLGLLSLWLSLDDLFMLHEEGIPVAVLRYPVYKDTVSFQIGYYITLALVMAVWAGIFRGRLANREASLLMCAGLWLGTALILDVLDDTESLPRYLANDKNLFLILEDGCKLFGIVTWLLYGVLVSRSVLKNEG